MNIERGDKTLKLVLTDHWFEEIKSGRKTHEYRELKTYWNLRLIPTYQWGYVEFQKAYRKNAEKMTFRVKNISVCEVGLNTDLKIDKTVYDFELGERIK